MHQTAVVKQERSNYFEEQKHACRSLKCITQAAVTTDKYKTVSSAVCGVLLEVYELEIK